MGSINDIILYCMCILYIKCNMKLACLGVIEIDLGRISSGMTDTCINLKATSAARAPRLDLVVMFYIDI